MAITTTDPYTVVNGSHTRPIDPQLIARAHERRERAERLRNQATGVNELLATTYRRRASELELEAWASEVTSGLPLDEINPVAA